MAVFHSQPEARYRGAGHEGGTNKSAEWRTSEPGSAFNGSRGAFILGQVFTLYK